MKKIEKKLISPSGKTSVVLSLRSNQTRKYKSKKNLSYNNFYILYLYPKNVAKDYLSILKFDNLKKDR